MGPIDVKVAAYRGRTGPIWGLGGPISTAQGVDPGAYRPVWVPRRRLKTRNSSIVMVISSPTGHHGDLSTSRTGTSLPLPSPCPPGYGAYEDSARADNGHRWHHPVRPPCWKGTTPSALPPHEPPRRGHAHGYTQGSRDVVAVHDVLAPVIVRTSPNIARTSLVHT